MAGFQEAGTPTLTDEIIAGVKRRFAEYGHSPSPQHWSGLEAIAANIEAQASGTAAPNFYLSSLPTGMGKTTVLIESLRALVGRPEFEDVGAVIFVNQLEQISRLIEESGLDEHQYAVRTGKQNEELNALGNEDPREAQVLFTTQQKLPHLLRFQKDFPEISFFQFRGTPRGVRIWDEAILPAEPLTLTADEIKDLVEYLAQRDQQKVSELLKTWLEKELQDAPSGRPVKMPSFILHLDWNHLDKLENDNDLLQRAFWIVSWPPKTVPIWA
jgi:hypothetical protein